MREATLPICPVGYTDIISIAMKSYCSAPFVNVRVDADKNGTIFGPCCYYTPRKYYNSIQDYLASEELKNLQQHFITQDTLPTGCQACAVNESNGLISSRTHFNNKFQHTDNKIQQLEIFPGNVCNLKCFMCNPDDSSALGAEYKKLGWIKNYQETDNADNVLEVLKAVDTVEKVIFIGGEFFLTKKNLEILDLTIEKKLQVELVTNATIILPEHLNRLKQIAQLKIMISIDGHGDSYEFMRYPASWSTVENNINLLRKNLPKTLFQIHMVAQPLNILHLIPAIDYLNRWIIPIHVTNLQSPLWLSWPIFNRNELDTVKSILDQQLATHKLTRQQHEQIGAYQSMLDQIKPDPDLRQDFVKRMQEIINERQLSSTKLKSHFAGLDTLLEEIMV